MVSSTAKILRMCCKIAKTPCIVSEDPEEIKDTCKEIDTFVFADPIKIINVNLNIEGGRCSFTFSEPATCVDVTAKAPVKMVIENITGDKHSKQQEQVEKRYDLCKKCWIFSIPQCNKCVFNSSCDKPDYGTDQNERCLAKQNTKEVVNKTTQHSCSYCWLYTNLDKCYYCHRSNITKPQDNGKNSLEISNEGKTMPILTSKRTLKTLSPDETQDTPTKKLKWQCHVCLTINDGNRATCVCCESSELFTETGTINLGLHKEVLVEILASKDCVMNVVNPSQLNTQEIANAEVVNLAELKTQEKAKLTKVSEMIEPIQLMDTSTDPDSDLQQTFAETTQNAELIEPMDVNYEEKIDQDVQYMPVASLYAGLFEGIPTSAALDCIPGIMNTHLLTTAAKSLQFNIGSGDKNYNMRNPSGRVKRPIRRNTSHK